MKDPEQRNKRIAAGMTGNSNAQRGDEAQTARIHITTTPEKKVAWITAARKSGMKLTEWLTIAADNQLKAGDKPDKDA